MILVVYGYLGWALFVFIIAGVTDALDGLIARRSGQKTNLGAWLDPMADKLLLVTTFVVLTLPGLGLENRFPIWLTVLIISRDIGIVLTVAIVNLAVGPRTFRPSMLGKAATAIYIVTAVAALFFNYLGYRSRVFDLFIYASLGITLASGLDYIWHAAANHRKAASARRRNVMNARRVPSLGRSWSLGLRRGLSPIDRATRRRSRRWSRPSAGTFVIDLAPDAAPNQTALLHQAGDRRRLRRHHLPPRDQIRHGAGRRSAHEGPVEARPVRDRRSQRRESGGASRRR